MTIDDVMHLLDVEISRVSANPKEDLCEEEWWQEWMEDIYVYPCEITHTITNEEQEDIKTALTLLNHYTAPSREEYINRISTNFLALKVKLNDLRNNMDITRIPYPSEKDYARLDRYEKEYHILIDALNHFH